MSAPLPPSDPRAEQGAASDESIVAVHDQLLHQEPEPTQGYSVTPLFLLGLMSAMIFVCSIYVVHNRGGFSSLVYDERFVPATAVAGEKSGPDPIAVGKRLFANNCAACHQVSGQGVPGVYPPLVGSEWVTGSEDRVIRIVLNGLTGPIEVKGTTYNNVMPAFGQVPGGAYNWSDEQVAAVLTYIRQEWGNQAAPVDPAKVAEVHAAEGNRGSTAWTAQELLALP